MKSRRFYWLTLCFVLPGLFLSFFTSPFTAVKADDLTVTPSPTINWNPTSPPISTAYPYPVSRLNLPITYSWTDYVWQLIRWPGNVVDCVLVIDHELFPEETEVVKGCTPLVVDLWRNRTDCPGWFEGGDLSTCKGDYFRWIEGIPRQKTVTKDFLPPSAWIQLSGCTQIEDLPNRCLGLPELEITGEEPISTERIIKIEGTIGSTPFECDTNPCKVALTETDSTGVRAEFWTTSSLGDQSKHYSALIRAVPVSKVPEIEQTFVQDQWIIDVLSSQWRGAPPASCADTWEVFPSLPGPPEWLRAEKNAQNLASKEPLAFLAGWLIRSGEVNAESCPSAGMLDTQAANTCGLELARSAVVEWQNQFDGDIIRSAQIHNVPPRVIKKIFDRESQFWPGIYDTNLEAGLGHLTEGGADTLLMWNEPYFKGFCPSVYSQSACSKGYFSFGDNERSILRGALLSKVNAACADCPNGIDLEKARYSIDVFAAGLHASCEQTAQIVYNVTNKLAGQSVNFEDLWQFTLVNYNAGPGCLDTAIRASFSAGETLNWKTVSSRLEEVCKSAIVYVDDARWMSPVESTPTTTVPQETSTISPTPAISPTPIVATNQTPSIPPYPAVTPYP